MPTAPAPPESSSSTPATGALLDRPAGERLRENKYRFGQAVVFGVPVVALQQFGWRLGGEADAGRWVGIFEAILSGWVVYVAAGGLLFEGLLWLFSRRRMTGGLVVAVVSIAIYLCGAVSVVHIFVNGRLWFRPLLFQYSILLLAGWSGWGWWRLASAARRGGRDSA